MRFLGIDPGYAIVGFGVVSYHGADFTPLEYGAITTEAGTRFAARLTAIYDDLDFLLKRFQLNSCREAMMVLMVSTLLPCALASFSMSASSVGTNSCRGGSRKRMVTGLPSRASYSCLKSFC